MPIPRPSIGAPTSIATTAGIWQHDTFYSFWDRFKYLRGEHNNHDLVRTIYQNTIDYDTPPIFIQPLPDFDVDKNHPPLQIDLWLYSEDAESNNSQLTYQASSDFGCNITFTENRFLNIFLVHDWTGTCNITIIIDDSIQRYPPSDSFQVKVEDRKYAYLLTLYLMLVR